MPLTFTERVAVLYSAPGGSVEVSVAECVRLLTIFKDQYTSGMILGKARAILRRSQCLGEAPVGRDLRRGYVNKMENISHMFHT